MKDVYVFKFNYNTLPFTTLNFKLDQLKQIIDTDKNNINYDKIVEIYNEIYKYRSSIYKSNILFEDILYVSQLINEGVTYICYIFLNDIINRLKSLRLSKNNFCKSIKIDLKLRGEYVEILNKAISILSEINYDKDIIYILISIKLYII